MVGANGNALPAGVHPTSIWLLPGTVRALTPVIYWKRPLRNLSSFHFAPGTKNQTPRDFSLYYSYTQEEDDSSEKNKKPFTGFP